MSAALARHLLAGDLMSMSRSTARCNSDTFPDLVIRFPLPFLYPMTGGGKLLELAGRSGLKPTEGREGCTRRLQSTKAPDVPLAECGPAKLPIIDLTSTERRDHQDHFRIAHPFAIPNEE